MSIFITHYQQHFNSNIHNFFLVEENYELFRTIKIRFRNGSVSEFRFLKNFNLSLYGIDHLIEKCFVDILQPVFRLLPKEEP